MPSSVIRLSRTQGRMRKNQRANGRPIQSTTALAISGIFMYIGGSLGPPATGSKKGPLTHRMNT